MKDSPVDDIKIGLITQQWAQSQKIQCQYFDTIDSTNALAKDESFIDESFNHQLILYVAEMQSAGKGRSNKKWLNTKTGGQLLCTWSFMVSEPPQPIATPLIGLALYKAAMATWPFLNWSLKAPNDLYLNNKKIAGLLIETISQGDEYRLLVGLGLNVLSEPNLDTATSLMSCLPKDSALLAEDWISFLERLLFEISFTLPMCFEPLNSTSTVALAHALNKNPNLVEEVLKVESDGSIKTSTTTILWHEL